MEQITAFATVLIPIIAALVQLVKIAVNMPKRFVPVIGLVIGLLVGMFAAPLTDLDLILRLWAGGIAGLSATGLFELAFNKHDGNTKDKSPQ